MAYILSTNKIVIIPGKKSFVYYNDVNNGRLFIPREQYEECVRQAVEVEGKPKIVQGRNCYSISREKLKELQDKSDYLGIEKEVHLEVEKKEEPKKEEKTIIAYQDASTKAIYIPIQYTGEESGTKIILDKPCTEVSLQDLENMVNTKIIIVTVYCRPNKALSIPLCCINGQNFISEEIATIFDLDTSSRRRIRVDGDYFIQVSEGELPNIQIEGASVEFEKKEIFPVRKQAERQVQMQK